MSPVSLVFPLSVDQPDILSGTRVNAACQVVFVLFGLYSHRLKL